MERGGAEEQERKRKCCSVGHMSVRQQWHTLIGILQSGHHAVALPFGPQTFVACSTPPSSQRAGDEPTRA